MADETVAGNQQPAWLSVSGAAKRLGVSRQAIQNRIKRGTLETRRNNRGELVVLCPATGGATLQTAVAQQTVSATVAPDPPPAARQGVGGEPDSQPASAYHQLIETLHGALERQERQHRDQLADRDRHHREAVEFWKERCDSAECRAEQATAALNDLVNRILSVIPAPQSAEPWWARWLGGSRRSDIRGS